jgi:hypothetical protein
MSHISHRVTHRYLAPALAWDKKAKGRLIKLTSDYKMKKSQDCAASIRTATPLPVTGRHYFEVKFLRKSAKGGGTLGSCYYIGVVVDDGKIDYENSLGEATQNWCAEGEELLWKRW